MSLPSLPAAIYQPLPHALVGAQIVIGYLAGPAIVVSAVVQAVRGGEAFPIGGIVVALAFSAPLALLARLLHRRVHSVFLFPDRLVLGNEQVVLLDDIERLENIPFVWGPPGKPRTVVLRNGRRIWFFATPEGLALLQSLRPRLRDS